MCQTACAVVVTVESANILLCRLAPDMYVRTYVLVLVNVSYPPQSTTFTPDGEEEFGQDASAAAATAHSGLHINLRPCLNSISNFAALFFFLLLFYLAK